MRFSAGDETLAASAANEGLGHDVMTTRRRPALSILIPTRDRHDSLLETLHCLAATPCDDDVEVVVIDNGSTPPLDAERLRRSSAGTLRLLRELRPGKARALNRALEVGGLGDVVAVLDDDMSPAPGWAAAVIAASRRLPEFDIFSGRSHVMWPDGAARPPWASHSLAQGLAFSVVDRGDNEDHEMGQGALEYPSGNHFWFRNGVLTSAPRFPETWACEPEFVVSARLAGHRGVFVGGVRCGHRIQPELLREAALLARARQFGRACARIELVRVARVNNGVRLVGARLALTTRRMLGLPRWMMRGMLAAREDESARAPGRARALWGISQALYHVGIGRGGSS